MYKQTNIPATRPTRPRRAESGSKVEPKLGVKAVGKMGGEPQTERLPCHVSSHKLVIGNLDLLILKYIETLKPV